MYFYRVVTLFENDMILLVFYFQGFCLSFLTEVDRSSHPIVERLIVDQVVGSKNTKALLKQPLRAPSGQQHQQFEGYWIRNGTKEPKVPEDYVLTPSVRLNLKDLSRVVCAGYVGSFL